MKKKKIVLFVFLMMGVLSLILTYKFKQNNLRNNKPIKEEKLSIMIKEQGATDYTKSSSKDIPKGDYILNEEKSYCKNNGKIEGYDSTTGTVSFAFIGTDRCFLYFDYIMPKLYDSIAERYNNGDEFVKLYNGATYGDTTTYVNNIYYFNGAVENNNVLFADKCWKIVRTTDTGGVKIVYNGVQKDTYNTEPINQDEYINVTNDATYPYTFDSTNKTWTSTNHTNSATGTITFSVKEDGDYYLNYSVSSESGWDKAYFYKNGNIVGNASYSGTVSGTISLTGFTTSDVIKVSYTKDSSGSGGSDNVVFSIGKAVGDAIKTCNNTGTDTEIGQSKFNEEGDSLAYFGYMFNKNKIYKKSTKQVIHRQNISGTIAYADAVTHGVFEGMVGYSLDSNSAATIDVTEDNISTLVGKYTVCNRSSITSSCNIAYYIVGYSETTIYYYILSDGETDGTSYSIDYVFGNSFTYENGTYTLSDTISINSDTWFENETNVNNYHYTCLTNGNSCAYVYYIDYDDRGTLTYITLTNGKSVEDALNEMLYDDDVNTDDSTIKTYIDTWYKNNLTSYTNKLEDAMFCNNRLISDKGGWNPNGGNIYKYLYFRINDIYNSSEYSLECINETDRFTVNKKNGNGKLTYPVGLLTTPETFLSRSNSGNCYLITGSNYWQISPYYYDRGTVYIYGMDSNNNGHSFKNTRSSGVRPVISLKPGTEISKGDGSYLNPFVIN